MVIYPTVNFHSFALLSAISMVKKNGVISNPGFSLLHAACRYLLLLNLICTFFLTLPVNLEAQDKILLISGREIPCRVTRVTDFDIYYIKTPDAPERKIDRDGVYAVNYGNGHTLFIYRPDPESGDENRYSYKEMRMFIQGQQEAKKGFRPASAYIGSFVFGFAGSQVGLFYGPLVPATFSFVFGIPQVRLQPKSVSNANYLLDDSYVQGYLKAAKAKKVQALVRGSILGFVTGFTTFYIYYKSTDRQQ
ncbi:MAG: hypothetical protein HYY40_04030 [Bacteroidetes bacterium]|nr:hypothetical protein [Bacteroidota bacterium]